ncbi:MAG: diguanylate cyclase [Proteobacteria bacterium]|nr:diguanylate cyclase [Pseudomonadota bacterium]
MKVGIAVRLGLALALVGVLAAGLTGYYGYAESRAMLVAAAEERLLTSTRVLVRQLTVGLENTARDVCLIAEHPQAARLLRRADPAMQVSSERNVALLFQRMLETHPEYFQMRLIDAADHGLERIRVDRDVSGVVRIEGDELQEKGHYPYVFETVKLPAGAVYVSRAEINHEVGAHAGQGKPSLQVAAPIRDRADGPVLGLVVINVDLNGLFAQLAADLPPGLQLYLSNGRGDFLVHPDPGQAFAFDRGQRASVQEQFPATEALLTGRTGQAGQLVTTSRPAGREAVVAAFVRQHFTSLHSEDDFILGLSQPLAVVVEQSARLGGATLRIVVGFSALAVLLAFLLARALTRPLHQIVLAVRGYAPGLPSGRLPSARQDEIGVLARSIEDMQQQIRAQFDSLEEKQRALDRLASHDSLTGLPNRRLFLDRLDQALAHARRNDGHLALLFIDLDNFKTINDSLGHAAGDAVLCAAAVRLQQLVRASDTVARLGGDEFIMLLDGADDPEAIAHLAEKALRALAQPVMHKGQALQSGGSIGVSRYPHDATGATELIAMADKAMYRAKSGGRQRACFAEAS